MNAIPAKPTIAALPPLSELERCLISPLPIRVAGDQFRLCPDGDGPVATFAPVETPQGQLVDVVGWLDDDPNEWWSLRGLAHIIGEPELALAKLNGQPLLLFETPAAWRRCEYPWAACVISWECDLSFAFSGLKTILTETDRLHERLVQRARVAGPLPCKIYSTRGR